MRLHRQHGFTLLEVMVALAVLAIALIAAIKAIGGQINNQAYIKERTFAHWVAMNKLAEIRLTGNVPDSGLSGDVDMAGVNYRWTVKVEVLPVIEDGSVKRLDITIANGEEPDRKLATLSGFVGKSS